MDFSEKIQELIREEYVRLRTEGDEIREQLRKNRIAIDTLQKHCTHPNAKHGDLYGYPTIECPDCRYGAVFLNISSTNISRGRKKKEKVEG